MAFFAHAYSWTREDVARWLKDVGFEKYIDYFYDNAIDGQVLLSLTKQDLFYMVKVFNETFKLGEVLKFEPYLSQLKELQGLQFPDGVPSQPQLVSNEANWKDGGFEENVRVMESANPDYCWRYKSVDVLFKDYVPLANGEPSTANAFPALATHVISPVDFYVQPNLIQPMVKKLQEQLQDAYSESTSAVPRENIFVGMPCVTRYKEDDNWYRAQVVDVVGVDEAPVRFVDWGNRQYSNFDDLKPLKSEFGRLPHAALQCRIRGVRERTLEQKVLEGFHAEMESLGCEVLISIVSSAAEPFLVELFNKYTNENIGSKYLPKEPICPKLPPMDALKKKKDRERVVLEGKGVAGATNGESETKVFACDLDAFMHGDIDEYSSSDDGQTGEIKRTNKKIRKIQHEEKLQAQRKWPPKSAEEEERFRVVKWPNTEISFQRRFRKQRKPLAGTVEIRVAHVESTKEIYVRILPLEEASGNVQDALIEVYSDQTKPVPALPPEFVAVDNVCVIYDPESNAWYRCRIVEENNSGVVLQAVDVGMRFPTISPAEYGRLKMLLCTSCLEMPPQAFLCRIDQLCENQPTPTETSILQELLPMGCFKKAEFERSREPYRLRMLEPETNESFVNRFEKVLDERGLRGIIACERRPCTDLAVWQQPKYVEVVDKLKQEKRQSVASSKSATNIGSKAEEERSQSVAVAGGKDEAKKPSMTRGFMNDIDAVLSGNVAVGGYDSDEDYEHRATEAATGRGGRRRLRGRAGDIEDEEKDERGSVNDFTEEKKQLVAKWLEKAAPVSGASNGAGNQPAPKRQSVAALYNPDLTRKPTQKSAQPFSMGKVANEAAKSVHGGNSAGVKRDVKARLPIQSAQTCMNAGGSRT